MMAQAATAIALFASAPALAVEKFALSESWDWQLSEPLDLSRDVKVLDLHPGLVTKADLAALKERGIKTICYVSVGTIEDTSPDLGVFPPEVIGKRYVDWPAERFLDVRRLDVLIPLMKARFESCRELGFDAIEPDNMDVYDNQSGFDLSEADTLAYVAALADEAHGLGLAIGQKNVPDMTARLMPVMDFAITESCFQDGWCASMKPYVVAGKAVYDAEYDDRPLDLADACAEAQTLGISMIVKDRDLTRHLKTCPH